MNLTFDNLSALSQVLSVARGVFFGGSSPHAARLWLGFGHPHLEPQPGAGVGVKSHQNPGVDAEIGASLPEFMDFKLFEKKLVASKKSLDSLRVSGCTEPLVPKGPPTPTMVLGLNEANQYKIRGGPFLSLVLA